MTQSDQIGARRKVPAVKATRTGPSSVRTRHGVNVFCRSWGDGRAVVFLHSWALSGQMWTYQMAHLAALGVQCVAFDRRGHGRSDQPSDGYDMDTMADDLADVIDAFDLQDVVLVGHSMGGGEILRYVGRHGTSKVSKIVLLAPATPFLLQTADNPNGLPDAALAQVRAEWASDFPKWIEDNKLPFFLSQTSPQMMDWLVRDMQQTPVPVAIACNKALAETDLRPDLPKVDRPTLVIQGDNDASVPLEITGRPTAAGIKGAILKVYPGAPHGLFLTHMERVNQDIATFIQP
ncbi:MAG: alpha/beta hydrolase [Chthoniobacterales bacterium]|nr:alpha/beta hydrolase [Chthoniobacterales bacterium]